jgi:hypothetical protein
MASLHIDKEFDDILNLLKTKLGTDKKQIVQQAILYIYKNKINPENIKESDPSAELKALRKDLVGFIKTQEKEKLEPILQKLDYVIDKLNKLGSSSTSTSSPNPNTEQYHSLVIAFKKLTENNSKLVELYNNAIKSLSQKQGTIIDEVKTLNITVENKLSKKIL